MKISAIIPARLGSTRLPRKVLADILGKPLIQHVWERVSQAKTIDAVYIATDSVEVQTAAAAWGANVLMTSPDCRSGTERLATCLDRVNADAIINVQGDEPLIDPALLDLLAQHWQDTAPAQLGKPGDLITPVFRIHDPAEIHDSNIVKVARSSAGEVLYFSRSPIPFVRDLAPARWLDEYTFWGHIGVYGYCRDVLAAYPALPVSALETAENLEQLRFLDAGFRFQTVETDYRPVAVDVAADLEHVRALLGR